MKNVIRKMIYDNLFWLAVYVGTYLIISPTYKTNGFSAYIIIQLVVGFIIARASSYIAIFLLREIERKFFSGYPKRDFNANICDITEFVIITNFFKANMTAKLTAALFIYIIVFCVVFVLVIRLVENIWYKHKKQKISVRSK